MIQATCFRLHPGLSDCGREWFPGAEGGWSWEESDLILHKIHTLSESLLPGE